jgi:hypothetical protein
MYSSDTPQPLHPKNVTNAHRNAPLYTITTPPNTIKKIEGISVKKIRGGSGVKRSMRSRKILAVSQGIALLSFKGKNSV